MNISDDNQENLTLSMDDPMAPDTPTDSDTAARARALLDAYPEDVFRPLADTVAYVMLSNGQMATSDAFAAHVMRTIALPVITDLLAEVDRWRWAAVDAERQCDELEAERD